jgi:hypothetical protein
MPMSRVDRDLVRGRRAAERVRAAGGSAVEAALAHIEATFSPAMRHSIFKDRVAAAIRHGPLHPQAARYRSIAECHPLANLDTAILLIERWRRAELDARAKAIEAWGRCSRPRLATMVLDELRLILRHLRRYAPAQYPRSSRGCLTRCRGKASDGQRQGIGNLDEIRCPELYFPVTGE